MGASAAESYSTPAPAQTATPPKPPAMVPKGLFLLVVNYASLMTLAVVYLLFFAGGGSGGGGGSKGSPTDSLPDVEPRQDAKSKKITAVKIPVTQETIGSHQVLNIGDTKHFGHFDVTVKKVEHGRIEFANKDGGNTGLVSPPVEVLKLHVTFKNTSKDQTIAPLRGLAFLQWKERGERISNSYFSPLAHRGRGILPYPLDDKVESIKGLNVNQEIKPGESADFFIPTTDLGLGPILKQHKEFVWRVQFRKGYSPKQYGVTTLFEVRFNKEAIEDA